jgi:uncharacterized membrane protein required for colicin V production
MMFSVFDIIIFTIIAISTIMGLYKGLLGIVINLLGFLASIIAAIFVFPYIEEGLRGHVQNSLLLSILSGTVSYICSLFVLTSITSRISNLLTFISRGFIDSTLGVFAGFGRGVIIDTIIFTLIVIFSSGSYLKAQNAQEVLSNIDNEKYPVWLKDSKTTIYLEKSLNKLISFFPEDFLKSIKTPNMNTKKNQDIIDEINNRKGLGTGSSVIIQ